MRSATFTPFLPCRAEEAGGISVLEKIGAEWDDLVLRSAEPTPFLRAAWMRTWWRAFGKGRPRVVVVRDGDGRLVGGAVFAHHLGRHRGLPVRILALAANVHSNRAELIADPDFAPDVGRALARWACERRRGWNLLRVEAIPGDSRALRAFREELDRLGFPLGTKSAEQPPYISIRDGKAAFEASLASKWKSNLRNREKRIVQEGVLSHETLRDAGPKLDAALEACLALEAKAWKGAAGSAIVSQPATARFYRDLVRAAAADGTLRLHTLHVGDRLAAFQLDLEANGVEYVLKIGYEPTLSKFSPGALLLKRVIEGAIARGLHTVDLLGDDMPWKRDWTNAARPHVKLLAFGRGALGRSLHAVEFLAVPAIKAMRRKPRPAVPAPAPVPAPATATAPVPATVPVSAAASVSQPEVATP